MLIHQLPRQLLRHFPRCERPNGVEQDAMLLSHLHNQVAMDMHMQGRARHTVKLQTM